MIRGDQGETEHDPDDQFRNVFNTLEDLAEYARAGNLTRADELLEGIIALLLAYRSTIDKAE
jgi:hypothetical protein